MSNVIQSPPIKDPVVDKDGRANKSWVFYFNQVSEGDDGTSWTPIATNLGGSYALSGKYYKNSGFIDFYITIDPTTSSTSTAGSTYIDLPFDVSIASVCFATYSSTALIGAVDPSTNKIYPPSWSGITSVVTLTGRAFTK